jgi:hypothetical protein
MEKENNKYIDDLLLGIEQAWKDIEINAINNGEHREVNLSPSVIPKEKSKKIEVMDPEWPEISF